MKFIGNAFQMIDGDPKYFSSLYVFYVCLTIKLYTYLSIYLSSMVLALAIWKTLIH